MTKNKIVQEKKKILFLLTGFLWGEMFMYLFTNPISIIGMSSCILIVLYTILMVKNGLFE